MALVTHDQLDVAVSRIRGRIGRPRGASGHAPGQRMARRLRRSRTELLTPIRRRAFVALEPLTRRTDVQFIGTQYGGWPVVLDPSARDGVCYSAGVGEDASFDCTLIERTGCTVHAFDPVPRAAQYVARAVAGQPKFVFHAVGLWSTDTEVTFFSPERQHWVSHSAVDFRHTPAAFKAPVRSVPSLMRELGHERLSVLKLSVEGAQFAVLEPVLAAGIPVDQILVEFTPPVSVRKMREQCVKLRATGYDLVGMWYSKCTFVRRGFPIATEPRPNTATRVTDAGVFSQASHPTWTTDKRDLTRGLTM